MRTLILATLSLVSLCPSSDADRVPEPTVFRLENHLDRTWVVTNEAPTTKLAWRRVWPGSYDSTQIADGPALDRPFTFTLVGASGARVVSSRSRMYLKDTFQRREPTSAVEIDAKADAAIALAGKHADATWSAVTEIKTSPADIEWTKAHGVTGFNPDYLRVTELGDLQTIIVLTERSTITLVRSRDKLVTRFDGVALGVVTVSGERFFVVAADNHDRRALRNLAVDFGAPVATRAR